MRSLRQGLNNLQSDRENWISRNFADDTVVDSFMGAVEEMGELAHSLLKRKQGIRGTPEQHGEAIKDAVADVIIFLAGIASHEGFKLGDVVDDVWAEVSKRDWVANPQAGIGEPRPAPAPYDGLAMLDQQRMFDQ